MDAKIVGNFIMVLRRRNGWTQAVLANKLNISEKTVLRWETGRGYPDVEEFPILSGLFGVGVDELMQGYRNIAEIKDSSNAEFAPEKVGVSLSQRQKDKIAKEVFKQKLRIPIIIILCLLFIATAAFGIYFAAKNREMSEYEQAPFLAVSVDDGEPIYLTEYKSFKAAAMPGYEFTGFYYRYADGTEKLFDENLFGELLNSRSSHTADIDTCDITSHWIKKSVLPVKIGRSCDLSDTRCIEVSVGSPSFYSLSFDGGYGITTYINGEKQAFTDSGVIYLCDDNMLLEFETEYAADIQVTVGYLSCDDSVTLGIPARDGMNYDGATAACCVYKWSPRYAGIYSVTVPKGTEIVGISNEPNTDYSASEPINSETSTRIIGSPDNYYVTVRNVSEGTVDVSAAVFMLENVAESTVDAITVDGTYTMSSEQNDHYCKFTATDDGLYKFLIDRQSCGGVIYNSDFTERHGVFGGERSTYAMIYKGETVYFYFSVKKQPDKSGVYNLTLSRRDFYTEWYVNGEKVGGAVKVKKGQNYVLECRYGNEKEYTADKFAEQRLNEYNNFVIAGNTVYVPETAESGNYGCIEAQYGDLCLTECIVLEIE